MGKSIGIDLGTTNSVAAIDDGHLRVLPTRMNEPLTPSVVSYRRAREAGKTGEILVGRVALNNAVSAPEETVFSIKRLIGRAYDDPKISEVRDRFPYPIQCADDDSQGIRIPLGDQKYSPVEISALILKRIVEDARRALDADITHTVITVPAYFSEAQRAATRKAGEQAGLLIKKIIDEPTAAAVAFGMDHKAKNHRLLVYDFGGGTFDVSVIQMVKQQFQVLAIDGDNWLGGDDLDREIAALITDWVKTQTGYDPSDNKRYVMIARQAAEKAKIALSGQEEVDIIIPAAVRTPEGDVVDVDMTLSRQAFEDIVRPYAERSLALVRGVLAGQNLTPDDITAVLMVGGTTAIPLVHTMVAGLFGEEKVKHTVDPMQCVAMGAALLAVRLKSIECPQCQTENAESAQQCQECGHALSTGQASGEIGLGEVTAKNLGIQAVDAKGRSNAFSVIIPKGTPYPLRQPQERGFYTTTEKLIRMPVYEGDNALALRNELQGLIEFPLPEDVPPNTPVAVQFNYDKDRVLTVTVRVQGRDDLTRTQELQRDRPRAGFEPEDDRWRQDLDTIANVAEVFVAKYREYMEPSLVKKTEADIAQAKRAFAENNTVEGKRLTQALQMAILGSGVASQLFLTERAMEGAEPEQAKILDQAARDLKNAYSNGDQQKVEKISMGLQTAVAQRFQEHSRLAGMESQDYKGLLREDPRL